ncbi:MAG: hypothetical protein IKE00_04280 [Oscillospiraceae bacterium]|jgi:hypothetical protein|nr:hypothetical protein [Oscillospiraceae bacterium]
MDQNPRLPDGPEKEPEKESYTPRPKWHVVFAWILLGIVVLGVINICYWEIFG